jgi:predicted metal-dependent hydrolase
MKKHSKRISLKGIGQIVLQRSHRARRVGLKIEPFKGIRITVPAGVSYDQAVTFAEENRGWIIKHLERVKTVETRAAAYNTRMPINRTVARRIIVDRLEQLAQRYGFVYNRVFVRNQKTRWGSCSAANNINLNINLIRLPKNLMDYTILHELVHTRIKNHGPAFWSELSKFMNDPKQVDRQLNTYSPMLFLNNLTG